MRVHPHTRVAHTRRAHIIHVTHASRIHHTITKKNYKKNFHTHNTCAITCLKQKKIIKKNFHQQKKKFFKKKKLSLRKKKIFEI